jgi:hypothetical protein
MIFAAQGTVDAERLAIAQAIENQNPHAIKQHVASGSIVSAMDAPGHRLSCNLCRVPRRHSRFSPASCLVRQSRNQLQQQYRGMRSDDD